jgi:ferric-dicitrate binding protein FerR (iron transport regulator)
MSEFNQDIFEKLIADNRFTTWVSRTDLSDDKYWRVWENDHPQFAAEFNEAIRVTKTLTFKGSDIKNSDIVYSWNKLSEKIQEQDSPSRYNYFIGQIRKIAAVLILPLLVGSAWLMYSHQSISMKYSDLLANKQAQRLTVVAPFCARTVVDLPDGTKVWLNSGSELTYPVVFNSGERRVHLTGEAYFKVSKGEVPFLVNNLGPEIKVYGTEFNVNSYDNEEQVTVALVEGKVSLIRGTKEEFIHPGQVSSFNRQTKEFKIENSDVNNYSCWREGKYVFRDTSLSAIMRILQRQYNVDINLLDPQLGNYRYNMTIKNENLEQILQLLAISAPIKCNYKPKEFKPDGTYVPDKVEISIDKSRIVKN